VLDFINESDIATGMVQRVDNPMLQNLLNHLSTWKPRRSFEYEDEYQGSLHRHLKMNMPEAEAKREFPVRLKGSNKPRRIDIVVADCVAIEMKRDFYKAGEIQRAKGQLGENVQTWSKGPIILVVCDVEKGALAKELSDLIGQLRSMNRAVMAVAAGTRSRA
jgi:hypothetical protein